VPGFFSPTVVHDQHFVDGGTHSPLPVNVALAKGATEIYALDIAFDIRRVPTIKGSLNIGEVSARPVQYKRTIDALELARAAGVTFHHIPFYDFPMVALGDFSNTDAMIEAGARATREYLANPQPNKIRYPHRFSEGELPKGPPGAKPML
jgi:predicted acylesterase/phospholipase RssA